MTTSKVQQSAEELRFEIYDYCMENEIPESSVTTYVEEDHVKIKIEPSVGEEHADAIQKIAEKYER